MATYKSDIIGKKESLDVSSKSLGGEKTSAPVLYATAEVSFGYPDRYPAGGDVLELADIPAGATVVPELSYVSKDFAYRDFKLALGDKHGLYRYGYVATPNHGGGSNAANFGYGMAGQAFFGTNASSVIPPYTEPTRVRAYFESLDSSALVEGKMRFGIAYRAHA